MLFHARIWVPVASPTGLDLPVGTELNPFKVDVGEVEVLIAPVLDARPFDEYIEGPGGDEVLATIDAQALTAITADLTLEIVDGKRDHIDPIERARFTEPGTVALRAFLRHLRDISSRPEIDVHLNGMRVDYFDHQGEQLPWYAVTELSLDMFDPSLESGDWEAASKAVLADKEIALDRELLLDARASFLAGNYTMAVLQAAILCERLVFNKLVRGMRANGRLHGADVQPLADKLAKMEQARILRLFYDVPDMRLEAIRTTFAERDKIVHRGRRYLTDRAIVVSAIEAAEWLTKVEPIPGSG